MITIKTRHPRNKSNHNKHSSKLEEKMNTKKIYIILEIVLISLLSVTTAIAGGIEENSEVETTHCYAISQDPINASRYSGDDIYDPAFVSEVELAQVNVVMALVPCESIDYYQNSGSSFSGDDAYDPAVNDVFEISLNIGRSFSGDDAYDPAAGVEF